MRLIQETKRKQLFYKDFYLTVKLMRNILKHHFLGRNPWSSTVNAHCTTEERGQPKMWVVLYMGGEVQIVYFFVDVLHEQPLMQFFAKIINCSL